MLTKEHGIAEYDRFGIKPDRLIRNLHTNYPKYAKQMVEVYKTGKGKTRKDLHRKIHDIFKSETGLPG